MRRTTPSRTWTELLNWDSACPPVPTAHRSSLDSSAIPCRAVYPRKAGNIGSMWVGYAKAAARRVVSPKHCTKLPAALNAARLGSCRRTSTSGGEATEAEVMEPDAEVLKTLVCPLSKLPLTYDPEARELISPVGVAYPITASGVPNMMPSCARLVEGQKEGL